MTRPATSFLALVLLTGTAFEAEAAQYIVNGGFEDGNFTGWTVVDSTPGCTTCLAVDSLSSGVGYGPNSGTYFAYLGTNPASTISQTFADTAGQTLAVSFYYASNGDLNPPPPNSNELQALFNGTAKFTGTNIASTGTIVGTTIPLYVEVTFDVTATGLDTLSFSSFDVPSALALDDVTVTSVPSATPLPAALPLFAGGLGALGLLGWRKKRKNASAILMV
jgi:hypothetical protein